MMCIPSPQRQVVGVVGYVDAQALQSRVWWVYKTIDNIGVPPTEDGCVHSLRTQGRTQPIVRMTEWVVQDNGTLLKVVQAVQLRRRIPGCDSHVVINHIQS